MSHHRRRPRQPLPRALTLTLALSLALGSASCVGELSGGASGEGERTTQTAGDAVDSALYYAEHISVTAEAIREARAEVDANEMIVAALTVEPFEGSQS